jgi:hypothetical protein
VDEAFRAALAQEAQAAPPPEVPPPPRRAVDTDPEAPHGRAEDGTPLAPFGINKRTGLPNKSAGGPGRGHRERPRVVDPPLGKPAAAGGPRETAAAGAYAEDLAGLATSVWIGASALQGGTLPLVKIRTPDLRPFAYLWHEQTPQLVAAWAQAAQSNATVRGWVGKLAGEGSWQWVIAVGVTSANFLAGCAELAKAQNAALRAQFTAANDAELSAFLAAQIGQAAGPGAPGPAELGKAAVA